MIPIFDANHQSSLSSSLVGNWTFNEGTGLFAYDYSGKNNTGTWAGTKAGTGSTYYAAGRLSGGYAGYFDGSTNYVSASPNALFGVTACSASVWFNVRGTVGQHCLVSKAFNGPPWSPPYLSLLIRTNSATKMEYDVGNGTHYSDAVFTVTTMTANTWYHAMLTYNGTTLTGYLNGVSVGTNTVVSGALDSANHPILIGADFGSSPHGEYWVGLIQNVRIWTKSLSSAQVQQVYANGIGPGGTP